MPTIQETVKRVLAANTLDLRVAQIRLIPQHHGTAEHTEIFAEIAKTLYLSHLSPDFAYIHEAKFHGKSYFEEIYEVAITETDHFKKVSRNHLDALGPVVRDTEGRVFTLSTLTSMLEMAPLASLIDKKC